MVQIIMLPLVVLVLGAIQVSEVELSERRLLREGRQPESQFTAGLNRA